MPSPTAETRTLNDLIVVLHDLGLVDRPHSLADAEMLVGWESAVVRTQDGWIYRFARKGPESFRRELEVLALVDGQLGVPTPHIEVVDHEHLLMAYRTITGTYLDLPRVLAQPPSDRRALVESLATVLASMHALIGVDVDRIAAPALDPTGMAAQVRAVFASLDLADQTLLDEVLAAWDGCALVGPCERPVLLHGDFHFGNMVFGGPAGVVTGLWDFTCVEHGDPAADFRYLTGDSTVLAAEVAYAYTALTGRFVDVDAARLMLVLEDASDAIAEKRSVSDALRLWRQ